MIRNLLFGGSPWSYLRLLLILLTTLFFMLLGRLFFELIGFSGNFLRFLYLPLAAFIGALLLGARYIQDTYRLPRFRLALKYILAAFSGIGYPRLVIEGGKPAIKPDEINLLALIGGPGYINIKPGNVAFIENLNGSARILSAGSHFVWRSETVKETASLEDQHGYIERVPATTKDGISVEVRDVHFRYRLRTGPPPGVYARRTTALQYPYSVEAVQDMAYNRTVKSTGLTSWHDAIQSVVKSTITEQINQQRIDDLTAPSVADGNPRLGIAQLLNLAPTREQLNRLGAELLWCDIGHFDIPEPSPDEEDKYKDPRPEKWGAVWTGSAAVERAYGDAQRLAYQELGRAEAQAEMLMSIVGALNDVQLAADPNQNLRRVILMRTAQILEALTEKLQPPPGSPRLPERSKPPRRR